MKLKLKKEALKVLTEAETRMVAGATDDGCSGTECGDTWMAQCGTEGTVTYDCTNYCPSAQYNCTWTTWTCS